MHHSPPLRRNFHPAYWRHCTRGRRRRTSWPCWTKHWEWDLPALPMLASRLGDRRYNEHWEDLSDQCHRARASSEPRDFLRRAYAIDQDCLERTPAQLRAVSSHAAGHGRRYQFNAPLDAVLHHRGGVQNLENNTNHLSFESVQDYEDWLAANGQDRAIHRADHRARRARAQGRLLAAENADAADSGPNCRAARQQRRRESIFSTVRHEMPDRSPGWGPATTAGKRATTRLKTLCCPPIENLIAISTTPTCRQSRQRWLVRTAERQRLV